MYKCPKCKATINFGQESCSECGQPFKWPEAVEPIKEETPVKKRTKSKGESFTTVLVLMIVVFAVVTLVLAVVKHNYDQEQAKKARQEAILNIEIEENVYAEVANELSNLIAPYEGVEMPKYPYTEKKLTELRNRLYDAYGPSILREVSLTSETCKDDLLILKEKAAEVDEWNNETLNMQHEIIYGE